MIAELVMTGTGEHWMESGLCRVLGMDVEDFDDYGESAVVAKQTCIRCPVQTRCRTEHIEEPWGIWGGLNTLERAAYRVGEPIQVCEGCRTMFARRNATLCIACQQKKQAPRKLHKHVEQVRDLAAAGMSDVEIATEMCALLKVKYIKPTHVRGLRRRYGIAPGRAQGGNSHHRATVTGISEAGIQLARERGLEAFRELTVLEKLELLVMWIKDGGTKGSFCRVYKVSGSNVNTMYEKIADRLEKAS